MLPRNSENEKSDSQKTFDGRKCLVVLFVVRRAAIESHQVSTGRKPGPARARNDKSVALYSNQRGSSSASSKGGNTAVFSCEASCCKEPSRSQVSLAARRGRQARIIAALRLCSSTVISCSQRVRISATLSAPRLRPIAFRAHSSTRVVAGCGRPSVLQTIGWKVIPALASWGKIFEYRFTFR